MLNTSSEQPIINVSIIIPIYNADRYLQDCLESVLSQTYQFWELILVNDCATDNSHLIATTYANKYPNKIKYLVNSKNIGQGECRNIGVNHASGNWLFFLDSDDVIENNALEVLLESLNENYYDIILGNNYIIRNEEKLSTNNDIVKNFSFSRYSLGLYVWGTLFNSNFWLENKFKFPGFRYAEDLILMSRVWSSTELIHVINDAIYGYRVTENSATHKFYGFQEIYPVLQALLEFCCVEHKSDEMIAFALSNSYNFIKMVASPLARYKLFKLVKKYIRTFPNGSLYAAPPLINKSKLSKLKIIYATFGFYFFVRIDTRILKAALKRFY